jgi:adenylate cyclase class 1
LLLKEEFYRTSLYVAGQLPLWWAAPLEFGFRDYERLAMNLRRREWREFRAGDVIDLGFPVNPDPREYFGAALWQTHKSTRDPFTLY